MVDMDQEQTDERRLSAGPRRVLAVIAGALFIALLLNAPELEKEAKAKPFGTERDIWVGIWKPFAAVSRTFYLDRPRAWADDALDRDDGGAIFELPPTAGTPGAQPTATPEVPKQLIRTPTVEDPLRVWIGGDSMIKVLGESVLRQAFDTGVMAPVHEPQLQSGLTRPDFFDWPGELNRLSNREPGYDVFVVMFGANDSQGIKTPDGKIFQPGEEGWAAEYRRRAGGAMDVLKADNRLVAWVGQPIMESAKLSERMAELNAIYSEEAAKRPWVKFIDLWPLFATPEGKYDAYIADDDGELKLMRNPDGVHLVREGADKASRAILAVIKAEAKLP